MSPVPRPAEPHASFRGKEMSEAQRPQHLDTTPEADKIFLEINRGQAVGGSTTSYLRQTAPPPRAPEDPSICPCTRREGGGRTHSRAGVQSAYGQTPSHARPPGGAAARASASTTGTREPEPETQTGPPGTERPTAVPDRAGARDRKCAGPPPPGPRVWRWGGRRGGGRGRPALRLGSRERARCQLLAGGGRRGSPGPRQLAAWSLPPFCSGPRLLSERGCEDWRDPRPRGYALSPFSGV